MSEFNLPDLKTIGANSNEIRQKIVTSLDTSGSLRTNREVLGKGDISDPSELSGLEALPGGILCHRNFPQQALDAWLYLRQPQMVNGAEITLPVAPILARKDGSLHITKEGDGEKSKIYSRFCGLSIQQIYTAALEYQLLSKKYEKDPKLDIFLDTLEEQRSQFEAVLKAEPVIDDNTHEGNLTVEFVDKEYLQQNLAAGQTINTLPYSAEHFTFEPQEYLNNMDRYAMVVRLIDFDNASMTSLPTAEVAPIEQSILDRFQKGYIELTPKEVTQSEPLEKPPIEVAIPQPATSSSGSDMDVW